MATTGMEVAAYFHNKAQSVTCIGNGEPYQKVFGPAVGKALRKVRTHGHRNTFLEHFSQSKKPTLVCSIPLAHVLVVVIDSIQ